MDNLEDHINSIRTEWHALKEKWFHGETMDPVFEGVVRDFCLFDDTMQNVYQKVQVFMRGVEQLAHGMTALSDGVSTGLTQTQDLMIASESCKLKEATNQIARADAPHSAIAKLRRDMNFNILNPVQNHIANNRNLKVSLDIRRRRLVELNAAKKQFDDVVKRNLNHSDKRYLQAQSNFETAKMTFNDVDRHVFEWLYVLEEYRGDILDSTLQTLKYLEYEFFATSAHAISTSLPSRMEFRPMVEMTPDHLEPQVEMELQQAENEENCGTGGTGVEKEIADFSARLIDKKAKEQPSDDSGPALPVDPLSLCSLLSQGFEEGPARRALRLHQNDTQAALDWLVDGHGAEETKRKTASDGVRMPTTVKHVQKLKAVRRAQQEKLKQQRSDSARLEAAATEGGSARSSDDRPHGGTSNGNAEKSGIDDEDRHDVAESRVQHPPQDLLEMDATSPVKNGGPAGRGGMVTDLLNLDELPAEPTDFSKPIERTELPPQLSFDTSMCEKQPLPTSVAAGTAQLRTGFGQAKASVGQGMAGANASQGDALSQVLNQKSAAASTLPAGIAPELLSAIQAVAAQSQITPEQLLLAAQQLAGSGAPLAAAPISAGAAPAAAAMATSSPLQAAAPPFPASAAGPTQGSFLGSQGPVLPATGSDNFQGLDPLGAEPAKAPSVAKKDAFGGLVDFAPSGQAPSNT